MFKLRWKSVTAPRPSKSVELGQPGLASEVAVSVSAELQLFAEYKLYSEAAWNAAAVASNTAKTRPQKDTKPLCVRYLIPIAPNTTSAPSAATAILLELLAVVDVPDDGMAAAPRCAQAGWGPVVGKSEGANPATPTAGEPCTVGQEGVEDVATGAGRRGIPGSGAGATEARKRTIAKRRSVVY